MNSLSKHIIIIENIILKTSMTFVRVDDEGAPIPISEQVKREFKSPPSKL